MKMLFVMSAFALFLTSCTNVESFREPIDKLTTDWVHTTTMVTDFVNTLQSTQRDIQNQFAQMRVPKELTLSEASEDQITELKQGYQEEIGSLTELNGEVSAFIGKWQAEAEKLSELKSNLNTGDLGSGTNNLVSGLQQTVEAGKKELTNWKGELEDIQANTSDILDVFKTLIANLQGN